MKRITDQLKSKYVLLILALVGGIFFPSCDGTEEEEDTCTLALDKECFCKENPEEDACFEACEVAVTDEQVWISGALTGGEFVLMETGAALNTYEINYTAAGADAEFKFFNTANGTAGNWGAPVGQAADASGTVEAAIAGNDCGNENVAFNVENTNEDAFLKITLNTVTGAYTVTFEAGTACNTFTLEEQKYWIKMVGPVVIIDASGDPILDGEGNLQFDNGFEDRAGAGILMTEAEDGWVEGVIEYLPSWRLNFISFKIAANPDGSYGGASPDGSLVADFGLGPNGPDEGEDCLEVGAGTLVGKYFVVSFPDGVKTEAIPECTDTGGTVSDDGDVDSGAILYCLPPANQPAAGAGSTADEVIKVRFNPETLAYEIEFIAGTLTVR